MSLSSDIWQLMVGEVTWKTAVCLTTLSREHRRRSRAQNWLESAARRKVARDAPYCTVNESHVGLLKLLYQGQVTPYYLHPVPVSAQSTWLFELEAVDQYCNTLYATGNRMVILKGTILRPGQYMLFQSQFGATVWKKESELYDWLNRLRADTG